MADRLLEVKGLKVSFATEDGIVHAVDGVDFELDRGQVLGIVGESGSGKSVTAMTLLGLTRDRNTSFEGEVLYKGQDILSLPESGSARRPRQRDRDDLPGPDDVAEPGLQGRRPDRRGHPHARVRVEARRAEARDRAPAAGRHPAARAARLRLPAPVLGRNAPARDDRDGALVQPRHPRRRRAHHGAGRHDPGPDPRADRPAQGRLRLGGHPDHPRSRRRRRGRERHPGHVRGPRRRAGREARHLLRPADAVHVGPARLDPAARPPEAREALLDRGHAALADQPPPRLQVPPTLPARVQQVRDGARAQERRAGVEAPRPLLAQPGREAAPARQDRSPARRGLA